MVLSIGMIVKNEEKYLEKCLTALKPILENVDSELIIADTGSTDRTVDIAKKFTDNIFYFEWINDFAAARNSTLERAKGEWYMFIDADEIFEDCSEIIRFFKYEYKKYNSAAYIQRSLSSENSAENIYTDMSVARCTKIFPDTKFKNAIHETLAPMSPPLKYLNSAAIHYGYVYMNGGKTTDLAREKSKRNLSLLFDELREYDNVDIPGNRTLIYKQIADCYDIVQDFDKALEYVDLGLKKIKHDRIGIAIYYCHKIGLLLKNKRYHDIAKTVDEYLDMSVNPWHVGDIASDCFIYAIDGYSRYHLGEYEKSIESCARFLELYALYLDGKLNTYDLSMGPWMLNNSIITCVINVFFTCCRDEKKLFLADKYARLVPLEKFLGDRDFIASHLRQRVEIMENVGYKKLGKLYRQLDDFGKKYLLALIRPKVFKEAPGKRAVILKKLAPLGGMPAELAQIYSEYFENGSADFELIKSFLEKYGAENSEDMLYILMANNLDITPFLRARDFIADRAVQLLFINYEVPVSFFENYDVSAISKEGWDSSATLYGWIMVRVLDRKLTITKVFEKYCEIGLRWYREFRNDNMSGDIKAAFLANNLVSARRKRDSNLFYQAAEKLKSCIPDLAPMINAYCNEAEGDFAEDTSSEFAALAVQVKRNIRAMIDGGDIQSARGVLAELEGLCPDDPDVAALRAELDNTLQ